MDGYDQNINKKVSRKIKIIFFNLSDQPPSTQLPVAAAKAKEQTNALLPFLQ